jgi:hypothetical protein
LPVQLLDIQKKILNVNVIVIVNVIINVIVNFYFLYKF